MPTKATTTKKPAVKRAPIKRKPVAKKLAAVMTDATPVLRPAAIKRDVKRTYIFAVGRRKEAVARVRWHQKVGAGEITVNDRALAHYFPTNELQQLVRDPLTLTHQEKTGSYTVKVAGGGIQGQAEAVRLGIARTLVKDDADLRIVLKRAGFLRRDPRVKERKKYGLKRARRAPQWQKR